MRADFKKLERNGLIRILKHYKVDIKPDMKVSSLVSMAIKAFELSATPSESTVFDKVFAQTLPPPSSVVEPIQVRKRRRDQLDSECARVGEQVAANLSRHEEEGGWILANVLEYNSSTNAYSVQDEDDATRIMSLPLADVKRLEDTAGHIRKGDKVIAVFPDTTSFYRANVVKTPKNPTHGNGSWEVIVKFVDDEDDAGRTPARRIPARFVLKRADIDDLLDDD